MSYFILPASQINLSTVGSGFTINNNTSKEINRIIFYGFIRKLQRNEGKAGRGGGGGVRLIKMECPILFSAPYFFSLQMENHVLSPTSYLSLRPSNLHLSQRFPYSSVGFKFTGFQYWTLCSEKNTTIMDERNLQTSTFRNDIKSVQLLQDMRSGCV